MLTFKTVKGKHVVMYNGVTLEFKALIEAWRAVYSINQDYR